jgi:type VI secretion system ImpC/EvpB family protein
MSRTETPLDLFVLADLVPSASHPPRRVDKDELEALLRGSAPTLRLGARQTEVRFETYRDFRPETLAERLPECAAILALLRAAREVAAGRRSPESVVASIDPGTLPRGLVDAVRAAAGGPAPAPRAPAPPPREDTVAFGDDPLANIFEMVDSGPGAGTPRSAAQALDSLLAGILGKSVVAGKNPTMAQLLPAVEAALSETLRTAMAAPAFRELESAWQGLRFLVRRVDFRAGVRVHITATPRPDLRSAVRTTLERADDVRAEGRTAVVLLDFDFEPEDRALAAEIAALAEAHNVPCLAGAAPRLAGVETGALLDRAPDLAAWFDSAEMAGWRSFRGEDAARWLSLSLNRFLLRAPYGRQGEAIKAFPFEEALGPSDPLCWGRPVWVLGERIASSFVRTGWGVDACGAGEGGTVSDLPVRNLVLKTGEEVHFPLEALLSESRVLELSRGGLTTLAGRRNSDQAFTATTPLLFAPKKGADAAAYQIDARRATLSYQLMVAEVTAMMQQIMAQVDWHAPAWAIAKTLSAGIQILTLTPAGPLFLVTIESPREGDDSAKTISLRLAPHLDPVRALPDFPLALAVPGR